MKNLALAISNYKIIKIILKLLVLSFLFYLSFSLCYRLYVDFFSSTFFKSLDSNADLQLSRVEWQRYYIDVNVNYDMKVRFYNADCDDNGTLTWFEYSKGVMRNRMCPQPKIHYTLTNASTQAYRANRPSIIVLAGREYTSWENAVSMAGSEIFKSNFPSDYDHWEDRVASSQELEEISISCVPREPRSSIVQFATILNSSNALILACSINNRLMETITALTLSLHSKKADATMTFNYEKGIFIPASKAEHLYLLYANDIELSNIRINSARIATD